MYTKPGCDPICIVRRLFISSAHILRHSIAYSVLHSSTLELKIWSHLPASFFVQNFWNSFWCSSITLNCSFSHLLERMNSSSIFTVIWKLLVLPPSCIGFRFTDFIHFLAGPCFWLCSEFAPRFVLIHLSLIFFSKFWLIRLLSTCDLHILHFSLFHTPLALLVLKLLFFMNGPRTP